DWVLGIFGVRDACQRAGCAIPSDCHSHGVCDGATELASLNAKCVATGDCAVLDPGSALVRSCANSESTVLSCIHSGAQSRTLRNESLSPHRAVLVLRTRDISRVDALECARRCGPDLDLAAAEDRRFRSLQLISYDLDCGVCLLFFDLTVEASGLCVPGDSSGPDLGVAVASGRGLAKASASVRGSVCALRFSFDFSGTHGSVYFSPPAGPVGASGCRSAASNDGSGGQPDVGCPETRMESAADRNSYSRNFCGCGCIAAGCGADE